MNEMLPPFVAEFNQIVEDSENLLFMVRDSDLQRSVCSNLEEALLSIRAEKKVAATRGDENYANLLLGCECVASALIAELRMWLLLKDEKPEEAWDQLVTAQMASVDAARAHDGFHHLEHHNQRLEVIEQVIFPSQVFISAGMIVKYQECSVCGQDYDECEHLVGKPYMGTFCHIIAREIVADHVALVEHPADKRCRVQRFSVDGGTRNRMTWKIEPHE